MIEHFITINTVDIDDRLKDYSTDYKKHQETLVEDKKDKPEFTGIVITNDG